jgi:hypothetical protein
VHIDRLHDPLHRARPDAGELEAPRDERRSARCKEDLADVGDLLHPGRDVHRESLRGVVDPRLVADAPYHHRPPR